MQKAILPCVTVVLILLSMTFSGSESAFLSINKLRIRSLHNRQNKKAMRVWKLLNDKEKLINTLLVANEIVNIAISSIIAYLSLEIFGKAGVGVATFVSTMLLLVFGEITPKTIATHHPEPIAFFISPLIQLLEVLLFPFVFMFTTISRTVLKLCGINTQKQNVSFTQDEIKTFIDVGGEQGIVEKNEKLMMHRVFKFSDLEAKDIMIPRKNIKTIHISASYDSIIEMSQRFFLSRFPVYNKDIDDIVGILYIKDLLHYKSCQNLFSVSKVMRPPLFILETKKMSSIQQMLQENHQSMAVVIDEYSGTYGVLTSEDIAREIFGPITDEYKPYARRVEVQIKNPNSTDIDGLARLIDINEQLGINIQSSHSETIGGLIFETLGHIPFEGESIEHSGFKFTVKELDDKRIAKVHVARLQTTPV